VSLSRISLGLALLLTAACERAPSFDVVGSFVPQAIERSLSLRPEIGEQTAEREAARAEIRAARSAFFPTLQLQGQVGVFRAYGRQDLFPGVYIGPLTGLADFAYRTGDLLQSASRKSHP
jgi:hypothetical protein